MTAASAGPWVNTTCLLYHGRSCETHVGHLSYDTNHLQAASVKVMLYHTCIRCISKAVLCMTYGLPPALQ